MVAKVCSPKIIPLNHERYDPVTSTHEQNAGFVYVLEVRDINLPVCKIGRTVRNPDIRCQEINQGATGDFLWRVASQIAVSDCVALERIVHSKLEPLRQKNREFFNIPPDAAYTAIRSILESLEDIDELERFEPKNHAPEKIEVTRRKRSSRARSFRARDSQYAQLLATFTDIVGCKGRPFGQLNKPWFGMSDGVEGVQWNLGVNTESEKIRLGVNLEGISYGYWPISRFLQKELNGPQLFDVIENIEDPRRIQLSLFRDAWQVTARPHIVERNIGPEDLNLAEVTPEQWRAMLEEGLGCLNEERSYLGRARQKVTLANEPRNGPRERVMDVSPHLTIWTLLGPRETAEDRITPTLELLAPLHEWVSRQCK